MGGENASNSDLLMCVPMNKLHRRGLYVWGVSVMRAFQECHELSQAKKRNIRASAGFLSSLIALLALCGCTPSIRGAPERAFPLAAETEIVQRLAGSEWYEEYARSTGARRKELRDQIVLSRMYAIDLYYTEYEGQLTRERQDVGFFSTVANLALTSSATLIASKETKTILTAVATGLTGVKEAYDKEVLIERTILILQQQMRTKRKEVRVIILNRLSRDTSEYPLELAFTDIETYYRAGTITGALIDVSEDAGTRLATARAIEERVIVTKFAPVTDLGTRIRAFARNNISAVNDYLRRNHNDTPLAVFLRTATRADQLRMIQTLSIP